MDLVRAAAVGAGQMTLKGAWPEFFGVQAGPDGAPAMEGTEEGELAFPSTDADMTEFEWEQPTPEDFASDMDALLALNRNVALPEPPDPPASPSAFVQADDWT